MDFKFEGKGIKFDKDLNKLDEFVFDFVKILEKHTDYIIVSGYVSILFGRARSTEDIDITVPELDKNKFIKLYEDLIKKGYSFFPPEGKNELYEFLQAGHSIRMTLQKTAIPNIELRFIKSFADRESFGDRIKVTVSGHTAYTAPLELQIAYKEVVLGSNKDREDAMHLRELFKGHLNITLLRKYEHQLAERKKHGEY